LWAGPKERFDQEALRRPPHTEPPPAGSRPELIQRYREVAAEFPAGDLPPLDQLGVTGHSHDGRTVRLMTQNLQQAATSLLLWARDAGVTLGSLDIRAASLEEAFLHIAREADGRGDSVTGSAAPLDT
ncbi:hypothetical protein ADL35_08315, partial [Streptomyces sp. NRRL WC-3753]